ncbi:uncharacterized protein LOC135072788 [Ostrinia nubilalis]|uniref:uncharacterized protein LOC135072788 n=1 Tax=Ostrinia nubilalis TaxID=29057 RepID=UPI00308229FC
MQVPEPPPPPLAPLWDRVLRARALPPDLDVELLYVAIRDRLTHPEWEVRLNALRVLADLLPLSGNALAFPFDQVVDNLGHNSPNVRKAALDALKVFCTHCEDSECAARAILDKCSYHNIRPHSANIDTKVNVITGLILSIPSVMTILKRRNPALDTFPIFQVLGDKLFDPVHRDVAQRSLLKLRKVCGHRDYMVSLSRLDLKVQDKFRQLCELYDEDSMDVYYAPRKSVYRDNNQTLVKINHVFSSPITTPIRVSTDSSSEDSYAHIPFPNNNYAKVIIETEIKFDSDTAITMTVLEENDTESDRNSVTNTGSEEDCDSSDRNMLKFSDADSEDTDVVVKKVRFGGESVKIRTPDSENLISSEDDNNHNKLIPKRDNINGLSHANGTPMIMSRINEIRREALDRDNNIKYPKKSGIPLPVIHNKSQNQNLSKYNKVKLKSKSLSELYDYFRTKNDGAERKKDRSGFALTLSEVRSPDKVPSPVEPHREVEVMHNLQRSPVVSPRRHQTRVHLERDGFVLNLLATSSNDSELLSPRAPSPLRARYDWEELGVVPRHVADQLHNTVTKCLNLLGSVGDVFQRFGAAVSASAVSAARALRTYDWEELGVVPRHVADQLHNTNLLGSVGGVFQRFGAAVSASAVSAARALRLGRACTFLDLLADSSNDSELSPRAPSPLRARYGWEELGVVPRHVADQLHNTDNWISAVRAADQLHSALLEPVNVAKVEPAAISLVQHMWALSEAVTAARAPAEGAVCALIRGASNDCARQLLPALVSRMAQEPLPTALPHALLQRLALHHLVDLIFDPAMLKVSGDSERVQSAQLRATLCLARAAGPAAVLSAVRRRLAGTARADVFCSKLREKLSRPVENIKPTHIARISVGAFVCRSSQLPVPVRRRARSTPPPAAPAPPRRLRPLPDSAPLPGVLPSGREYIMKALSPIPLSDRDSSALTSFEGTTVEKTSLSQLDKDSAEGVIIGDTTQICTSEGDVNDAPPTPKSPSIKVEDYSEKSIGSLYSNKETRFEHTPAISNASSVEELGSHHSTASEVHERIESRSSSRKSVTAKSRSASQSPAKSRNPSPDPISNAYEAAPSPLERDVRNALAECVVPARHEDWEIIVNGLLRIERLAADPTARAPATSWRAVARSAAAHVRSLRSRVARTACSTLGALFEHRGRTLDTELEEAATALLERCADVNRFLRADAAAALVRLAHGSNGARAAVALARRGAGHRAGPVRAAAAAALARLVRQHGAHGTLDMPPEPRTVLLRAAGELLGDASAEARAHARQLCLALSEDIRFRQMLKDAMQPTRYRAIEKFIEKLR